MVVFQAVVVGSVPKPKADSVEVSRKKEVCLRFS